MVLSAQDILVSLFRVVTGTAMGAILALLITVPLATNRKAVIGGLIVAAFFRSLPILALVPLFQHLLGIHEFSKICLIAWACFFPILISSWKSIRDPILDLELRIGLLENNKRVYYGHYVVPRLISGYLAGIEIALGIAWLTVVAAEMIGTFSQGFFRGGLGNFVFTSFENGNFSRGFTGLAVFGIMGMLTHFLWHLLSSRSDSLIMWIAQRLYGHGRFQKS